MRLRHGRSLGLAPGRLLAEPVGARRHDETPGIGFAELGLGQQLDQLVGREIGQIVQRLHPFAAKRDNVFERELVELQQVLAQASQLANFFPSRKKST